MLREFCLLNQALPYRIQPLREYHPVAGITFNVKSSPNTLVRSEMDFRSRMLDAMPELSGRPAPYDFEALKTIRQNFAEAGFTLYGLEGDQFDMSSIKLGLPDRDEWIERYQQMLRNMGQLGIRLLCYNFMASIGWFRTRTDIAERGGALVSEFDAEDARELVPEEQRISEDKLWENLFYFLDAVLPVAQENGV